MADVEFTATTDFNDDSEFSECEVDMAWATLQVKALIESDGTVVSIDGTNYTITDDATFKEAVSAQHTLNVAGTVAVADCGSVESLPLSIVVAESMLTKFLSPTLALLVNNYGQDILLDSSVNKNHLDIANAPYTAPKWDIKDAFECVQTFHSANGGIVLGESSLLLGEESFTMKFDQLGFNVNQWHNKFISNRTDDHGFEVKFNPSTSKFSLIIKHDAKNTSVELGAMPSITMGEWMTFSIAYKAPTREFAMYVQQDSTNHTIGTVTVDALQTNIGDSDDLVIYGDKKGSAFIKNIFVYDKHMLAAVLKWTTDTENKLNPVYFFPCDDTQAEVGDSIDSAPGHKILSQSSLNVGTEATFVGKTGGAGWVNQYHWNDNAVFHGEHCLRLTNTGPLVIDDSDIDWGTSWSFSMRFYPTTNGGVIFKKGDGFELKWYGGDKVSLAKPALFAFTKQVTDFKNNWHHVLLQKNGKLFAIYIDGDLVFQMNDHALKPGKRLGSYDADTDDDWKSVDMEVGGPSDFYVKEIALFNGAYGYYPVNKWYATAKYGLPANSWVADFPANSQIARLSDGSYWDVYSA